MVRGFSSLRLVDLPRPGIKSVSPALVGGFLTTGPPGKVPQHFFLKYIYIVSLYSIYCSLSIISVLLPVPDPLSFSMTVLREYVVRKYTFSLPLFLLLFFLSL